MSSCIAWDDVEKRVKSWTRELQSLPQELRLRALRLISEELTKTVDKLLPSTELLKELPTCNRSQPNSVRVCSSSKCRNKIANSTKRRTNEITLLNREKGEAANRISRLGDIKLEQDIADVSSTLISYEDTYLNGSRPKLEDVETRPSARDKIVKRVERTGLSSRVETTLLRMSGSVRSSSMHDDDDEVQEEDVQEQNGDLDNAQHSDLMNGTNHIREQPSAPQESPSLSLPVKRGRGRPKGSTLYRIVKEPVKRPRVIPEINLTVYREIRPKVVPEFRPMVVSEIVSRDISVIQPALILENVVISQTEPVPSEHSGGLAVSKIRELTTCKNDVNFQTDVGLKSELRPKRGRPRLKLRGRGRPRNAKVFRRKVKIQSKRDVNARVSFLKQKQESKHLNTLADDTRNRGNELLKPRTQEESGGAYSDDESTIDGCCSDDESSIEDFGKARQRTIKNGAALKLAEELQSDKLFVRRHGPVRLSSPGENYNVSSVVKLQLLGDHQITRLNEVRGENGLAAASNNELILSSSLDLSNHGKDDEKHDVHSDVASDQLRSLTNGDKNRTKTDTQLPRKRGRPRLSEDQKKASKVTTQKRKPVTSEPTIKLEINKVEIKEIVERINGEIEERNESGKGEIREINELGEVMGMRERGTNENKSVALSSVVTSQYRRGRPKKDESRVQVPKVVKVGKGRKRGSVNRSLESYEKRFQCDQCEKTYSSKGSFRQHMLLHSGESGYMFVCDLCGQGFTTSTSFRIHKLYHEEPNVPLPTDVFKCPHCKYIVSKQELLDEHYKHNHDPTRPKNYVCDVCGKRFYTPRHVKIHMRSHATHKPFQCDQCEFATTYDKYLTRHKHVKHSSGEREKYRCELCAAELQTLTGYKEHIQRHFNLRKKVCKTCGKRFMNASHLATHCRTHLAASVPCEICGKTLKSKAKLEIHQLIHTGKKDFACPHCSYTTGIKHNLRKHCKVRHDVVYPAPLCQPLRVYTPYEISADSLFDTRTKMMIKKINKATAAAEAAKTANEVAVDSLPMDLKTATVVEELGNVRD